MDPQPEEGPSTPPHTPGYDPPDQSVRFVVMYNGNKMRIKMGKIERS